MGFIDDFCDIIEVAGVAADCSRNGKPDPVVASALAVAMGFSNDQIDDLGAFLGANGAFDDDD